MNYRSGRAANLFWCAVRQAQRASWLYGRYTHATLCRKCKALMGVSRYDNCEICRKES